jgi:hypothetical protein
MVLGSTPLLAQPAPEARTAPPAKQATDKTAPTAAAPATQEQAQKSTSAGTGKDSPFDYRSSEEISEDVPVSFPVDI